MSVFIFAKKMLKDNISDAWLDRLKFVREICLFLPNYIYDAYRYARYSATILDVRNKEKLRAMLTKNSHIIEKGLSLPEPREGFGRIVVKKTMAQLDLYIDHHGIDALVFQVSNALKAYVNFNLSKSVDVSYLDEYLKGIDSKISNFEVLSKDGGVLIVRRDEILAKSLGSFSELVSNRFSIRIFDQEPVSDAIITEAANIARKTPSVCNRQTARVFVFGSEAKKQELLALQNGNRGFGHTASHIVAVTSDLHCFTGVGERNQAYVDGGLMAMSFVYALQSLGVGSCFLNWSVTADVDMKFKKVSGIPASHVIISLIAIGNIPEELRVAESPRLNVEDILTLY